jgi:VWFA-related protein
MTPEMGPQQITFARKTDVIERDLRENWAWGRRGSVGLDEREKLYDLCFPPFDEMSSPSALVKQMIARRREKIVLDSLSDLAHYMEAIRDGRTAVITVTSGWPLYRPDPAMLKPRKMSTGWQPDPIPGALPPVGVGPGGTLMKRPEDASGIADQGECDKDRYRLANLEDDVYLRNIITAANRANVSFYTVSPGGVSAYDPVHSPRTKSLEELSLNTNGVAVLHSNDMGTQFRRIAAELTSYYLFGYYSTNTRLDGRYRTITVKSKRPGVEVRARQGYRAASATEANAVRAAADLPIPEEKAAITQALGAIEREARAQTSHVRLPGEPALFHRGPSTGNQMQPATVRIFPRSDRVHLEMEAPAGSLPWVGALLDRNGATTAVPVGVGERTDASGQRWLTADLTLAPLGPGDYVVELTTPAGAERRRMLVAIRVTR